MNLKDLLDLIPELLDLFIPGFVFLAVCKYFIQSKGESFDITAIGSLVLSYIFQLASGMICDLLNIDSDWITIIAIVLSFIVAILVVKIRLTEFYKNIAKWIGKTTGSCNIWYDFFDINKGSRIRFNTLYNNKEVRVEGDVKYFEGYDDGECNIAISNYIITFSDDRVYTNNIAGATMIYNTKNIYRLEVQPGSK